MYIESEKFYFKQLNEFGLHGIQIFANDIDFKGTSYRSGFFLSKQHDKVMYKIFEMIVCHDNVIIVSTQMFYDYDMNLNAFILKDNSENLSLNNICEFQYYPSLPHKLSDGRLALRFKVI